MVDGALKSSVKKFGFKKEKVLSGMEKFLFATNVKSSLLNPATRVLQFP